MRIEELVGKLGGNNVAGFVDGLYWTSKFRHDPKGGLAAYEARQAQFEADAKKKTAATHAAEAARLNHAAPIAHKFNLYDRAEQLRDHFTQPDNEQAAPEEADAQKAERRKQVEHSVHSLIIGGAHLVSDTFAHIFEGDPSKALAAAAQRVANRAAKYDEINDRFRRSYYPKVDKGIVLLAKLKPIEDNIIPVMQKVPLLDQYVPFLHTFNPKLLGIVHSAAIRGEGFINELKVEAEGQARKAVKAGYNYLDNRFAISSKVSDIKSWINDRNPLSPSAPAPRAQSVPMSA